MKDIFVQNVDINVGICDHSSEARADVREHQIPDTGHQALRHYQALRHWAPTTMDLVFLWIFLFYVFPVLFLIFPTFSILPWTLKVVASLFKSDVDSRLAVVTSIFLFV